MPSQIISKVLNGFQCDLLEHFVPSSQCQYIPSITLKTPTLINGISESLPTTKNHHSLKEFILKFITGHQIVT